MEKREKYTNTKILHIEPYIVSLIVFECIIEVENSHVLLFVHKENNVICAISGNGLMFCSDRITLTRIHTNNRIERIK